ncbi:MAG TPA: hypothetical protein VKT32_06610, partial [Chthonomonadaceae bacterium]|nr:hypothetical protein [Chthonomonadaceae bacterium]
LASGRALAGPPFVTDDPEPVEFHHWEIYISSIYQHAFGGISGTLPHLEVNNGIAPNLQLHLIVPNAFSGMPGSPTQYGLGDTELGVKWRFVQESKTTPQIGIFPLLEAPTGDAGRGLGTGHLQTFLPVWIQKSWGPWTSYGGGGYWINPGAGNKNYWLTGWLLQKDLNAHWTLGGELFYTTSPAVGVRAQLDFNLGGYYNFDDGHHLLFSAGRSLSGDTTFMAYLGYQWTFGPGEHSTLKGAGENPRG